MAKGKNIDDLLDEVATSKTETKKSKSDTPILDIASDAQTGLTVLKWIEGKRMEKQGEALRKQQEELFLPKAELARKEWCLTHNKFHSSVKIKTSLAAARKALLEKAESLQGEARLAEIAKVGNLPDEATLALVVQNKYSEIPLTEKDKLIEIFGDDFNRCFSKQTKIEISEEGMAKLDEILPKLMEAVGGKEKFFQYFDLSRFYAPTEALHQGSVTDGKLAPLMAKAVTDKLVKPQKASLRE